MRLTAKASRPLGNAGISNRIVSNSEDGRRSNVHPRRSVIGRLAGEWD